MCHLFSLVSFSAVSFWPTLILKCFNSISTDSFELRALCIEFKIVFFPYSKYKTVHIKCPTFYYCRKQRTSALLTSCRPISLLCKLENTERGRYCELIKCSHNGFFAPALTCPKMVLVLLCGRRRFINGAAFQAPIIKQGARRCWRKQCQAANIAIFSRGKQISDHLSPPLSCRSFTTSPSWYLAKHELADTCCLSKHSN